MTRPKVVVTGNPGAELLAAISAVADYEIAASDEDFSNLKSLDELHPTPLVAPVVTQFRIPEQFSTLPPYVRDWRKIPLNKR